MAKLNTTQLSLEELRGDGYLAAVCEHWIAGANIRRDLYGFADIIAINAHETILVQVTSRGNMSSRRKKIIESEAAALWLQAPGRRIILHGWDKVAGVKKDGSPSMRMVPRLKREEIIS